MDYKERLLSVIMIIPFNHFFLKWGGRMDEWMMMERCLWRICAVILMVYEVSCVCELEVCEVGDEVESYEDLWWWSGGMWEGEHSKF
jgi:hypothetical protein